MNMYELEMLGYMRQAFDNYLENMKRLFDISDAMKAMAEMSFYAGGVASDDAYLYDIVVPVVNLVECDDVFVSNGGFPVKLDIYAVKENDVSARTRITVDGCIVADIIIFASGENKLAEEIKKISEEILLSNIRKKFYEYRRWRYENIMEG